MMLYTAIAAGAVVLLALLLRRRKLDSQRIKTLVVLGSGGHTAEMLRLITDFDFDRYAPLTLVTASTDTTSRPKAERELPRDTLATARWAEIPRARELGPVHDEAVRHVIHDAPRERERLDAAPRLDEDDTRTRQPC